MRRLLLKAICIAITLISLLTIMGSVVFAYAGSTVNEQSTVAATNEQRSSTAKAGQSEEGDLLSEKLDEIKAKFRVNFIADKRYMYLVTGLKNTLIITVFAVLLGVFLGFLTASVRYSYDELASENKQGFIKNILLCLNAFAKLYLTVIRGTPVVVQLMIIYFGIFAAVNVNKSVVAVIAFGINSGAYVAEIVRSGLFSIDRGQLEAGRSLGLGYISTMWNIIIPQAFKNILPALGNELIVLLKETSVAGYIALNDLTRGGDTIRGVTYNSLPLYAVALIYLIVVMILSHFVARLENHLKKDRKELSRKALRSAVNTGGENTK